MRVHHVGYIVKNIEKSIKVFENLGYKISRDTKYDEIRKIDITFMENDGYTVELVSPKSEDSVIYELSKKYKNMPYHICYISDDMDKDIEYLSNNGFVQMDEPCVAPCIDNKKVVFLFSNNIGIIELVEE